MLLRLIVGIKYLYLTKFLIISIMFFVIYIIILYFLLF